MSERTQPRPNTGPSGPRRLVSDALRDRDANPRPNGEHGKIWDAINDVRGKVNYALGALAVLIGLNLAMFGAVVLR